MQNANNHQMIERYISIHFFKDGEKLKKIIGCIKKGYLIFLKGFFIMPTSANQIQMLTKIEYELNEGVFCQRQKAPFFSVFYSKLQDCGSARQSGKQF